MNDRNFSLSEALHVLRRTVLYTLLCMVGLILVFASTAYLEHQKEKEVFIENETGLLDLASDELLSQFYSHAENVHQLLSNENFNQMITASSKGAADQVQQLFGSFIESTDNYTSLRYINNFGELVASASAVEGYPNSGFQIEKNLANLLEQNGSIPHESIDRYYLSPTFFVLQNEGNTSDVIVQLVIPVNIKDSFFGVVLLDMLASSVFAHYEKALSSSKGSPLLLNNKGHAIYLAEINGQQYSTSRTFDLSQQRASVWEKITEQQSGMVAVDEGMYLYHRVNPNPDLGSRPLAMGEWINISFLPRATLAFPFQHMLSNNKTFGLIGLAFSLLFSLLLALAKYRQQQASQHLHEDFKLLNESQRIAHMGNWLWHPDTDKMEWSDEMFRMLGFKPQIFQPTLLDYIERVHPDDKDKFKKNLKDSCYNGPFSIHHRLVLLNGSVRDMCMQTSGQTYYERADLKVFGTIQDVTEISQAIENIKLQDNRIKNMIEQMQDGYLLMQVVRNTKGDIYDFRYLEVNKAFENILQVKRENVINRTMLEVFPHTEPAWIQGIAEVAEKNTRRKFTQYSSALERHFEVTAFCPEEDLIAGFFSDVTARTLSHKHLQESAKVFDNTSEAIIICDENKKIIKVNKAFKTISEYSAEDVLGKTCSALRCHRHDEAFYENQEKSIATEGNWKGEMWNRRKNGELYAAWVNVSTVRDEHQNIISYIYVISDISPIKEAEERLTYLAHHDVLTGLSNRLAFTANLQRAIESANRHKNKIALFYLDLDDFKQINDSLGHAAGDYCLKVISDRLAQCVRSNDLVARLGGDEFAIVLEDLHHPQDLDALAEKIIHSVSEPITFGIDEITTTTSIGISVYPDDCSTAEEFTQTADTAMYKIKAKNPGFYEYFSSATNLSHYQNRAYEESLRLALKNDELQLFYQPQFNTSTGKIRGVEALLRWQHPRKGLVLPEQILSLARSGQLIKPLGDWVINEVCRQAKVWVDAGLPNILISVNLSLHQFLRNHIVGSLKAALDRHQLDLQQVTLELEITEEILHMNHGIKATLRELQALGVRIALENYGSVNTSLRELRELPINTLKVDASFLETLSGAEDALKESLTSAIVSTGHALGMRVIATCVETEQQMQRFTSLGCDEAQGYLLSQAVSNDDIHAMMVS